MAIRDDLLSSMITALIQNNAPAPIDKTIANKSLKSIAYPIGDTISANIGNIPIHGWSGASLTPSADWRTDVDGISLYYYIGLTEVDRVFLMLPAATCIVMKIGVTQQIANPRVLRYWALCGIPTKKWALPGLWYNYMGYNSEDSIAEPWWRNDWKRLWG